MLRKVVVASRYRRRRRVIRTIPGNDIAHRDNRGMQISLSFRENVTRARESTLGRDTFRGPGARQPRGRPHRRRCTVHGVAETVCSARHTGRPSGV